MPEMMQAKMQADATAARIKCAECSAREGRHTTEFKGKTGVQGLLLLVMILNRFNFDIQLDDETALLIIGGLEAAYALGRSILKGFQTRAMAEPHGSNNTVVNNHAPHPSTVAVAAPLDAGAAPLTKGPPS